MKKLANIQFGKSICGILAVLCLTMPGSALADNSTPKPDTSQQACFPEKDDGSCQAACCVAYTKNCERGYCQGKKQTNDNFGGAATAEKFLDEAAGKTGSN